MADGPGSNGPLHLLPGRTKVLAGRLPTMGQARAPARPALRLQLRQGLIRVLPQGSATVRAVSLAERPPQARIFPSSIRFQMRRCPDVAGAGDIDRSSMRYRQPETLCERTSASAVELRRPVPPDPVSRAPGPNDCGAVAVSGCSTKGPTLSRRQATGDGRGRRPRGLPATLHARGSGKAARPATVAGPENQGLGGRMPLQSLRDG